MAWPTLSERLSGECIEQSSLPCLKSLICPAVSPEGIDARGGPNAISNGKSALLQSTSGLRVSGPSGNLRRAITSALPPNQELWQRKKYRHPHFHRRLVQARRSGFAR